MRPVGGNVMASWPQRVAAGLGLTFVVFCVLAAPGFSAAAVLGPLVGLLTAACAWLFGLRRTAWLTTLVAIAAPIELALLDALSMSGDGLLLLWAGLILVACAMSGSYLIERRRAIKLQAETVRVG